MNKIFAIYFLLLSLQINAQQVLPRNSSGPLPPEGVDIKGITLGKGTTVEQVISGVPIYIWFRGCGPTSLGMVCGYYDTHGFPDLVPGDASTQTSAVYDVIATNAHYNDYALPLDDAGTGLKADKSETGGAHTDNCLADYMHTSQSIKGNYWMWSLPEDVVPAWVNYISHQASDYEGTGQMYSYGTAAWDALVASINNNQPCMALVDSDNDGIYDHFVPVIGYSIENDTKYYDLYNTWDENEHWFAFHPMQEGNNWGILNIFTFEIHSKFPATPGPIAGPVEVCKGQSGVVYSVPVIDGATSYIWTLPAGASGSSSTSSISVNFGSSSVSGNISVNGHNANGDGPSSTLPVTVSSPLTAPGPVSGSTTICQGSEQVYSITSITGATSYSWSLPSGWNGTSSTESITATAGTSGGTISVTAINACGTSTPGQLDVTVSTSPEQPGAITGETSVCQNSGQVYSIAPVSGASSYTWTLPTGWSGTSGTESITTTAGTSGGTISVKANNSCGSGPSRNLNVTVTTIPARPGTITGNTSVCLNSNQNYSVTAVPGATSYTWTLPSGWSGNSSSESITAVVGASDGTISVTANNSCGSSTLRNLNVTVSTVPDQPGTINGSSTVCQGSNQVYSISSVPAATSYTWTLPTGWSGTSSSESITATAGAIGGTITVKANNSCGSGISKNLNVTVSTIPAMPGVISGSTTICQGTIQVYSIASVSGATSYTWSLPTGWSGTSSSESITATAGTSGGTISVTAINACGTSTPGQLAVTVSTSPAQPGTIAGETSVCQNSGQVYSITPVSGATSYTWTLPTGWSGTSGTESITTTVGTIGGTISVKANNSCGSGPSRNLNVTVTTIPARPGTITGSVFVCLNSTQVYSIAAVSGATSYTWTLPNGWSGSSSSESITAIAGATGGTISVTANNYCGSGSPRNINVSVNTIPAQPGTISGETSACQNTAQVYSISAVSGATSYTWTLPSGWSGTSSSESISAIAGSGGGTISVTANNSCGSTTPRNLSVTVNPLPAQPGSISGQTTVCQGQTSVTYYVPVIADATSYVWTLPSGATGTSSTRSITINIGASANSGNISVKGNNACNDGPSSNLYITVNPLPPAPIITLNDNILYSSAIIGNQWYNQSGSIYDAINQDYTVLETDTYYVIVTLNGCVSEKSNSIYVVLTGTESSEINRPINVYPNPVKNQLIIEKPGNTENIKFEILNSIGQVVFKGNFVERTVVQASGFPGGTYIIKIESGKTFDFKKIIKN